MATRLCEWRRQGGSHHLPVWILISKWQQTWVRWPHKRSRPQGLHCGFTSQQTIYHLLQEHSPEARGGSLTAWRTAVKCWVPGTRKCSIKVNSYYCYYHITGAVSRDEHKNKFQGLNAFRHVMYLMLRTNCRVSRCPWRSFSRTFKFLQPVEAWLRCLNLPQMHFDLICDHRTK